jgi:hypothetical protein
MIFSPPDHASSSSFASQYHQSLVPVHRNALETGVLALAASDPKMMALFTSLLVKRDGESMAPTPFTCEPAMVHLPTGSSDGSHLEHMASFREIDATLRDVRIQQPWRFSVLSLLFLSFL